MSTIHDALKKVQNDMDSKTDQKPEEGKPKPKNPSSLFTSPSATPLPQGPSTTSSNKKTKKKTTALQVIFLLVLCICIGIAAAYRFKINFKYTIRKLSRNIMIKNPFKTPPEPKSLAKESVKSAGIMLSGIMTQGDHHVALINGEIHEEGSTVAGGIITKITSTSVTFEKDGQTYFFSTMPSN